MRLLYIKTLQTTFWTNSKKLSGRFSYKHNSMSVIHILSNAIITNSEHYFTWSFSPLQGEQRERHQAHSSLLQPRASLLSVLHQPPLPLPGLKERQTRTQTETRTTLWPGQRLKLSLRCWATYTINIHNQGLCTCRSRCLGGCTSRLVFHIPSRQPSWAGSREISCQVWPLVHIMTHCSYRYSGLVNTAIFFNCLANSSQSHWVFRCITCQATYKVP